MRIRKKNIFKFNLAVLFICGALVCVSVIGAGTPEFADAKSKSIYLKISAKIARYKSERAEKISRIKAKKYPPADEKAKIARINQKIDRAIQRYKEKGRSYFRRLGVPDPWNRKPVNEISPKNVPEKPIPTTIKQPVSVVKRRQTLDTPSTREKEITKSAKIAPGRNPNTIPSQSVRTPITKRVSTSSPVERPSDPAIDNRKVPSVSPSKPYNSSERQKNVIQVSAKKTSSHFGWKVFAAVLASFFFFLAAITVVANIATWKKRKTTARIALGCGMLFFGFLSLTTVLVTGYIFTFTSPDDRPSEAEKRIESYMVENAANWQDLGANLFAEAVVEGNRDKLFKAIGYLEKAFVGAPGDKGITVDLADAYMEVNSPSLTVMAIDLYESIFDSFDEDPLVARLASGYFQLRNYEAALAFSKERMKCCPDKMRIACAIQMAFIAASFNKEDIAISAISDDMKRRSYDPALDIIIGILEDGKGDKTAAATRLDSIIVDKNVEPKLREYAETVKKRVSNE